MSSSFKNLVEPGSTVAVSLPNIPQVSAETFPLFIVGHHPRLISSQYLLPVLGAIHAGSRVCLFNPIYTPEETKHAMQLTEPEVYSDSRT